MKDNRSDKVKNICWDYIDQDCEGCTLKQPCQTQAGDTKEIFDVRMNKAAEELGNVDET